jgi:catechol 2,3-dioxygenase-like lactoylglutathione lyase family enzyme
MKLNHVNLTVDDAPAARRFLEQHFGLHPYGEGMKNFDVLFHIGFIQPSEADVDEVNLLLHGAGRVHDRSAVLTEPAHVSTFAAWLRSQGRGCAQRISSGSRTSVARWSAGTPSITSAAPSEFFVRSGRISW